MMPHHGWPAALAAREGPAEPSELVAAVDSLGSAIDLGLADSLRAHAERKLTPFLDDLRPILRNANVHLDPDSSSLSQDRWEALAKVKHALTGLRWIALQLLDAELQGHAGVSLMELARSATRVMR
jgi:hypothetical protein